MSVQLFDKHEKKLRLQHVKRRYWERKQNFAREGKAIFKVPIAPKTTTTYRWFCEPPTQGNEAPRPYSVKFTPNVEKRAPIPERMYNQKRSFQLRRDARINYADAVFQPEKRPKEDDVPPQPERKEYSEQELRKFKEFQPFFENWDGDMFSEDDILETMESAINDRLEIYQEVYKQTSNPMYLAQAVFLKFLDLDRLSELHRMYLVLSEECEFPMSYVEEILRRHYE